MALAHARSSGRYRIAVCSIIIFAVYLQIGYSRAEILSPDGNMCKVALAGYPFAVKRFGDTPALERCYAAPPPLQMKDEFLRVTCLYLLLLKNGGWR